MHCTATCMESPASIHLQMTRIPHRETNKYTYVSSNMYDHIKNTARPPVENLCCWVNLLHCLCHSSIQGTNLILFHLQRSSGVRRWVALRRKKKTENTLVSLTVKSLWRTRQHSLTHQMKFQNKRLSCDLQFSSGAEKSEKTFQSVPLPLLCCYESDV